MSLANNELNGSSPTQRQPAGPPPSAGPWLSSNAAGAPPAQSQTRASSDTSQYPPPPPYSSTPSAYQYFPNLSGSHPVPGLDSAAPQQVPVSDPFGAALAQGNTKKRVRDGEEPNDDDYSGWPMQDQDSRGDLVGRMNPPPPAPTTQGGVVGASGKITKTHTDPLISQALNNDGTPKRPMNAFMIFARKRRPEVAAENPALRTGEISKLLSREWKSIDQESKAFYLAKAKSLKDNFTALFPQYVYRRRPNHSRKKRKIEQDPAGQYQGHDGEDDMDEGSASPGPYMHAAHGPSAFGAAGGPAPPPPHHLGGHPGPTGYHPYPSAGPGAPHHPPYGHHNAPIHRQHSTSSLRHYDGAAADSPRMGARGGYGAPGNRNSMGGPPPQSVRPHSNSTSGNQYTFGNIPSPNFGPVGRTNGSGGGGSNPPSAHQTPSLTPSLTPATMPGQQQQQGGSSTAYGSSSYGTSAPGAQGSSTQQPQPHSNPNPYGEWVPTSRAANSTPTPVDHQFRGTGPTSAGGGGSAATVQGVLSAGGAAAGHHHRGTGGGPPSAGAPRWP